MSKKRRNVKIPNQGRYNVRRDDEVSGDDNKELKNYVASQGDFNNNVIRNFDEVKFYQKSLSDLMFEMDVRTRAFKEILIEKNITNDEELKELVKKHAEILRKEALDAQEGYKKEIEITNQLEQNRVAVEVKKNINVEKIGDTVVPPKKLDALLEDMI